MFIDAFTIKKYLHFSTEELNNLHEFQKVFLYYLFLEFPEDSVLRRTESYIKRKEDIKKSSEEEDPQIKNLRRVFNLRGAEKETIEAEIAKIKKAKYREKISSLNKEFGIKENV